VHTHTRFIPDTEVETYFKAADVVVLPYTEIYQSGVPFLAFSFGRPVIATDVGSLRDDIEDHVNGFMCRPADWSDLAKSIQRFFSSNLYGTVESSSEVIRGIALERHSWASVAAKTEAAYRTASARGATGRRRQRDEEHGR
jgi:glycosyltransferase involved in cell wall biosynthesis